MGNQRILCLDCGSEVRTVAVDVKRKRYENHDYDEVVFGAGCDCSTWESSYEDGEIPNSWEPRPTRDIDF